MGDILVEILLLVIAISVLGAVAYSILFANRYPAERHTQTDLTNMMIMFQTMRDLVQDQKEMARQFNASLDKKVVTVRKLVSEARSEREKLWEAQHRLGRILGEVKEELGNVQRQVGYVRDAASGATQSPSVRRQGPGRAPQANRAPSADRVVIPRPRPEQRPVEEYHEDPEDVIDSWTGIDYGHAVGAETEHEAELPLQDAPENADAAREAFRSLLNLGDASEAESPAPAPRANGNGASRLTTLERRVYEYRDAGMDIPDIARELGVDRQEVRLILSARQARPHDQHAD